MTAEEIYDLISSAERKNNMIIIFPKSELTREIKNMCDKQRRVAVEMIRLTPNDPFAFPACPKCKKSQPEREPFRSKFDVITFCPSCGQKLDWSDEIETD